MSFKRIAQIDSEWAKFVRYIENPYGRNEIVMAYIYDDED